MQSAITNMEIEALAKGIGINQKLDGLGLNLGCEYETIDAYKASNRSDAKVTYQGTKQMLRDWRDEITQEEQQRPILKKALKDAGLARLAEKYLGGKAAMGTGQAGRSETKTLSDAPSGTRLRKGRNAVHEESDEEPVTVHQSGGDQTINAAGRSKVKGSTMTGTVKNMTVHNHPAEASTSQRQGKKRKAARSSGVKKRAKMGVEVHEEGEEPDESDEDEVREEEEESDGDEVHEEGEESDEDEVNEEEEESDEDESEEEEEEDSDEEPAIVHQRGGAQTINASGRSKVKGSTMTGPVTNVNIHNHPAEASTSQRQGRKSMVAGSSGGKKRAKMGAAPSGSRPKRKRKPATVRQSGGDQTINASGRSRVEGSTMTGPVTNMTTHNHPAEASTSQRQGRKRKAAGSSSGKKRAKMGGKR